uniref:Uncharacterized protein n=1 Tax=Anguilla anguilla TaxID=7936 RepID=A0A0E9XTP1_ANGAN
MVSLQEQRAIDLEKLVNLLIKSLCGLHLKTSHQI